MKMTKFFSIMAALALLTSCSQVKNNNGGTSANADPTGIEHHVDLTHFEGSYRVMPVELGMELNYITDVQAFPGCGKIYITGVDKRDNLLIYETDSTFSSAKLLEYEQPQCAGDFDMVYQNVYFNDDGTFVVLFRLDDHGGVKMPEEYDPDFDYEGFWENFTSVNMICTYDAGGKLLSEAEFELPWDYEDMDSDQISGIIPDGDGLIYGISDGSLWRLDKDGNLTHICDADVDTRLKTRFTLLRDNSGKLICQTFTAEDMYYTESQGETKFFELNGNELVEFKSELTEGDLVSGVGKYRFFCNDYLQCCGASADGSTETVINWVDSNSQSMNISAIADNEFVGFDTYSVYHIVARDLDELAKAEVLTIASPSLSGMGSYSEMMYKFNNSQDKYLLLSLDEGRDCESRADAVNDFNMKLVSGDVPDIVCGCDYDVFVNYRKKGLFTDLYGLMENDPELDRSKFLPNVINILESKNGELNGIFSNFYVQSCMTKTSTWGKQNWTIDEFIKLHDDCASYEHLYDGQTNIEMLHQMSFSMTDFIDWDKGVCSFDSPEFVKLLEFCGRYVNEVILPDKEDDAAHIKYWVDKNQWLANDKNLFEVSWVDDYNFIKKCRAGGADLTLAGIPTKDGSGGVITPDGIMGISAKCENKAGAWAFVKFVLEEEKRCSVIGEKFEKYMDSLMGESHTYSGMEIENFDQKTRDMVADYMKSCNRINYNGLSAFDDDVMNVIEEEATLYFGGEQTAEKAAANIQNRLSILVSERN